MEKCAIINSQGEIEIYLDTNYFNVINNRLTLSDDAVKAMFLDVYFPVDTGIYVQYPVAESNDESVAFPTSERPATKFGGTWTELYDDENVFFRTKGTDGQARSNGLSLDQIINHNHYSGTGSGGSIYDATYIATNVLGGYLSGFVNSSYQSGTFTEPRNRLFKIWKRTT